MAYRVELTARAARDLRLIYQHIHAESSPRAYDWFNGLEAAVAGLKNYPRRGATTPENRKLRHLLFGHKPHVYRVIYKVDEPARLVQVLHVRHGARDAFTSRPIK